MQRRFGVDGFQIITETIVDGLIMIDAHGVISYVNSGCERLFEYPHDELLGRNVSTLMPEPYASMHDSFLARHRENKVQRVIGMGRELRGLKSTGDEFPMYLSIGETQLDKQTAFVGIIYDLTATKQAEAMLLHHQKLEAIGQLSGGVAHDFNNILSVIGGNLEMLEQEDLSPPAKRAIVRAQDAAARASRVTHRLLAFARRQPLSIQPIDINNVIADTAMLLERSMPPNIRIELELGKDTPSIETDIDQVETALLNLVVNARDAMPDGGRVLIKTQRQEISPEPGSKGDVEPGIYARVSISDQGQGMSEATVRQAIEPFFTTKESGSGTGLGLSMVYGFIKQTGGQLLIRSKVNVGTCIILDFPMSTHQAVPDSDADVAPPKGRGELVLVVEDDPDVREATAARLIALDYAVRAAASPSDALKLLEQENDIRLVLSDVVMPGKMNGIGLAEEISNRFPGLPVILTSGYASELAAEPSRALQWPFLAKPVSKLTLAKALRSALDGTQNT